MKLGDLIKMEIESGDFLRLRINVDITKPLRRFVVVVGAGDHGDI